MAGKQGYTLKNWVEGLFDEAYYPWESQKNPTFASESFDSSIKDNFRVFQNHRKQTKNNVNFHSFPSLGLSKPP